MANVRINKYLADHQYASRREADEIIKQGKVYINGKKAVLGDRVEEGDKVEVKGKESKRKAYYAYNKPPGIVTVNAQEGEEEIKDYVKFPEKVYPVGRLDKDSEGLLIFTNDGRITTELLGPDSEHEKEYDVRVNKNITHMFLTRLQSGVDIGAVGPKKHYITKPALVRRTSQKTFDIVLTEGKNRQIRRMCAAYGYDVKKLRRFRIENISIGNLRKGEYREIEGKELKQFLHILGLD